VSTTVDQAGARQGGARRALVLHDRQLIVDLIELTLNHGLFVVQAARTLAEAEALLTDWQHDAASWWTWTMTTAPRSSAASAKRADSRAG
jgi:hypothetical protein